MADFCCVCDDGCEAPAGLMCGGGISTGKILTKKKCYLCGNNVCDNCSTRFSLKQREKKGRRRICNNCKQDQGKRS